MITISKSYSFDAAHQLYNLEWTEEENRKVFGKCSRLHGHTYNLDVTVEGPVELETGMVLNYFDLDKVVKPLIDGTVPYDPMALDHNYLNNVFPHMLTTAENMVAEISDMIVLELYKIYGEEIDFVLVMVSLSETPKTTAVWRK